jgi:signal peptidase I
MKLLTLGLALVLIIVIAIMALTNLSNISNVSSDTLSFENGLSTFKEEVCVDNFGNITCTEIIYLKCNGEEYKVPVMTGYVVHDKIYVPEYIEKEKIIVKEKKLNGEEKPSPADRIDDSDISVSGNSARINLKNAKWRRRRYIDSNSMDPLIDAGTTTIEIKPKYASEIQVGDIIAYDVEGYDYAFVHRVIKIGNDEDGVYFTTKGDNYWQEDPDKVRFSQIEGIVVGILY